MVAIGEHGPAAVYHLVQGPGHAHFEALHRAGEGLGIGRLDDHVNVVPLHRKVHQAEAEALAPSREGPLQRAKAAVRPQIPHFAADAQSDVQRAFAELLPRAMRDVGAGRLAPASGALARATPGSERKLLLCVLHCAMVAEGSDIASPGRGVWAMSAFSTGRQRL